MKLVTAIVRPITLDRIIVSLEKIEKFPGVTVSDAEGFGQRLRTSTQDVLNPFKPKKRIDIVCDDQMALQVIDSIRERAHTGKKGDGIIFVTPLEQFMLI